MSAPMTHIHIFPPPAKQRERFFKPHILTRLKNIIFRWKTDASWWFWADYYYGKEGLRPETNWELGKGWTARSNQLILLLTRWRRMILSSALLDLLVSVSQWLEFEHPCLWLSLSQPHSPIWDVNMHFVNLPLVQFSSQNLQFTSFPAVFVQNIKFRILTSFAAFCR